MARCRENVAAWLPNVSTALAGYYDVRVFVYEKCEAVAGGVAQAGDTASTPVHSTATSPVHHIALPNVGREGHAYLSHVVSRWRELPPTLLFVNGGLGSKPHVSASLVAVLSALRARSCANNGSSVLEYVDGAVSRVRPPSGPPTLAYHNGGALQLPPARPEPPEAWARDAALQCALQTAAGGACCTACGVVRCVCGCGCGALYLSSPNC